MLKIHSIPTGPLQANCHVLQSTESKELVVVDPGEDGAELIEFFKSLGGRISQIWNTHAHFDHIGANADVKAYSGAPISIHESEAECLESALKSGAALFGMPFVPSKADRRWRDGDVVEALGLSWTIHHAPGHSRGMCTIVCEAEKLVIAGDLILMNSIGRTDLPGGDERLMASSLRAFFEGYTKDDWTVLCGHGANSTVAKERRSNSDARWLMEAYPSVV
jgi:hydroxyacylglutathione hydrolase